MSPLNRPPNDRNAPTVSAGAGRRVFTILVVGHGRPRFRKVRVPYVHAAAALAVVAAILAAGILAPGLWFRVRTQTVSLEQLTEENLALRTERDSFDSTLSEVSERLDSFESRAGWLANALGLEDPSTAEPAAGGGEGTLQGETGYWFDGELHGLDARSQGLKRSIDDIDEAVRGRVRLLAATPNTMPVEGWFSHGYGWRSDPMTGKRAFHRGIDIVAPANTEILAPADGVVSRTGRYSDLGRSVDIAHGFGYVTRYAHMNKIEVQQGDRVRRGDLIGRVGSTGRSTGPHLHYEVFRDGRRVNPWKYLGHER